MDQTQATREVLWNIQGYYWIYPQFILALAIFAYGFWRKWLYWRAGAAEQAVTGPWLPRMTRTLADVLLQRKLVRSFLPGLFHISIFWAFIVLVIATLSVAVDMYLPFKIFRGGYYLGISLLADLAGGFFTFGLGLAFLRRYVWNRKKYPTRLDDAFIHGAFFFLMASGFVLEGIRIHYAGDPWAHWTPVGKLASFLFVPFAEAAGRAIHLSLWWLHAFVTFAFVAAIPYTRLSHIGVIPLNTLLATNRRRGEWARPDLEKLMEQSTDGEFTIGISTVKDLTWKQRLDHSACIECRRCDDHCPANLAGKNLSPMQIITSVRDMAMQASPDQALVGSANPIAPISLWECRTCYACVENCPAGINHLDHIIEMRRSEVLLKGELPGEAQTMLRTLETRGNPLGNQADRLAWIEKEGFKVLKPGEQVEALYWIGCATSFDQRKQRIARNVVKILETAKISYAVLGDKEMCTGDPARVVGDENIFQTAAKSQLAQIDASQFQYMLVNCPHCYNAFGNEYPQFGANFKVIHHTELIDQLIHAGRIKVDASFAQKKVAYHDPCYLGRVQGVYDQPRNLIEKVTGQAPIELGRNKEKSSCCGAGGGHYWMDLKEGGERLNNRRIAEVEASGADTLGVGCPFCMQMLEDGLRAKDKFETIAVRDIADLVAESLRP